jgi:hypothetical protein
LGAVYTRLRLRKHVASGAFTEEEVKSFTRGLALWIFIPCLALWLLQQSAGADAPPEYLRWPAPQKAGALALQVFVWGALLYWVFVRDGANTLSRYLQAAWSKSSFYSPIVFKLGAIAVVISGLAALLSSRA